MRYANYTISYKYTYDYQINHQQVYSDSFNNALIEFHCEMVNANDQETQIWLRSTSHEIEYWMNEISEEMEFEVVKIEKH